MEDTFYFMRKNSVDVMRYLPKFLAKSPTFKNTQNSLSLEHERYRLHLVDVARQLFLETATWSLPDWEKFLGITPREDSTFEARKAYCRVKLRGIETMTPANTVRMMQEFMTSGTADVEELGDNKIKLILDNGTYSWNEMFKALWTFLPAHLIWSLEFNRHFEHDWTIGGVNNYAGDMLIDDAALADTSITLLCDVANFHCGNKTVGLNFDVATPINDVRTGVYFGLGGYIEIKADEDDTDDYDGDWYKIIWDNWQKWKHNPLIKIYNHHFDVDQGEIDPDDPETPEIFPDGDFLRLYFKFPNTKRIRYTTLYNPRKEVAGREINVVGNYTAANKLLLNWRGDATTGITRALLIERTIEKIF